MLCWFCDMIRIEGAVIIVVEVIIKNDDFKLILVLSFQRLCTHLSWSTFLMVSLALVLTLSTRVLGLFCTITPSFNLGIRGMQR